MDTMVKKSIAKAGGVTALARALGIKHNSILQWRRIPVGRVHDVARITGIAPEDLRPDVFVYVSPKRREPAR